MMFERFTDQSRRAVVLAQEEAARLDHNHVGTEHLLAGLVREERGTAGQVLGGLGADPARLGEQVIQAIESQPEGQQLGPPLRLRKRARRPPPSDPVQALLDSIDERLSAIERHLGMDPGGSAG